MKIFDSNSATIFNNCVREAGLTILPQKTTAYSMTLMAKRILDEKDPSEQARALENQLRGLAFDQFEIRFNGTNQFEIIDLERKRFEEGLDAWVKQEKGLAQLAAERIKQAFYQDSFDLDLSSLRLTSLPSEIGQLSHLIELYVESNFLTSLPDTIGSLCNLGVMVLFDNRFEYLPDAIGNLSNLKRINVSYNSLIQLPEQIGNCVNLEEINAEVNQLKRLPTSIGQLSKLKSLDISSNKISSLPATIGQLTQLESFNCYENFLEELPYSISNLTNLKHLRIAINEFINVPDSIYALSSLVILDISQNYIEELSDRIGNLVNLKQLFINENELKYLPDAMGSLKHLTTLDTSVNIDLNTLPLSLGDCPQLEFLECEETGIPKEMQQNILRMCRNRKNGISFENLLSEQLQAWQTCCGEKFDFQFIDTFTDRDKQTLYDWLIRLKQTRDFNASFQKELAGTVCRMLESLHKSPSFKAVFFTQVPLNLEQCGDHAAMAFNELFLAWKLDTLDSQASEKEKLDLIMSASKTAALRCALQNRIQQQEMARKAVAELQCEMQDIPLLEEMWLVEEGVEIYLHYETTLRDRLKLLTFTNQKLYDGESDWIDEELLIEEVEQNYFEYMLDLQPLIAMRDQDTSYAATWETHYQSFTQEEEKLYQSLMANTIQEKVYKEKVDEVKEKLEAMQRNLTREWLKEKLQA